jgi:ubiquitin-protein ligase
LQHDYPNQPPDLIFVSQFWHPNVYPDGRVCISILHAAGDDERSGESFDIRWKPINSVSSVLNSVLLMLMEPNFSSPANVDASVEWRNEPEKYLATVKTLAVKEKNGFFACIFFMYLFVFFFFSAGQSSRPVLGEPQRGVDSAS